MEPGRATPTLLPDNHTRLDAKKRTRLQDLKIYMNNKKEQTIRQYAKVSEIPLKNVLEDLKKIGFF